VLSWSLCIKHGLDPSDTRTNDRGSEEGEVDDQAQGASPKRILFVDDEPFILEGLRDLLRRHRRTWNMVFALGGEAAIAELNADDYDVVISDMRMPGIDGAALLRHVQEEHPEGIRIVLSGHAEQEAALRAVPVAQQFLNKPASAALLENTIERALQLRALINDQVVRRVVGRLEALPSLPSIYMELTSVLADERSGARDVAVVVEKDPSMAAKVLQLVNSGFFGLGRRISSIEQAVSYLGLIMIKNLALSVKVFEPWRQSRVSGFSPETLRSHSLSVADLASRMAGPDRLSADDAFTAGLLHDVGKLVLALEVPEQLAAAVETSRRDGTPVHEAEQELSGVTHAEIGAYLLGLWGLPNPVIEAVANHHVPRRVPQQSFDTLTAVHVADALVHELEADPKNSTGGAPSLVDQDYLAQLGLSERLPLWRALASARKEKADEAARKPSSPLSCSAGRRTP
jgi:putative nucleotidyltransferase with HDIG domain